MERKFARRLAKALRSGDYTQTRGKLCRFTKNDKPCLCVMGVAAVISGAECKPPPVSEFFELGEGDPMVVFFPTLSQSFSTFLSETGRKVMGITAVEQDWLVNMNDSKHMSFTKIAEAIEKKYELT